MGEEEEQKGGAVIFELLSYRLSSVPDRLLYSATLLPPIPGPSHTSLTPLISFMMLDQGQKRWPNG